MELVIKGDPKEIAALVWELQERQRKEFIPSDSKAKCMDIMQKRDC